MKQGGFGRVEILWLGVVDDPATKAHGAAACIADWKHDPIAKAVVAMLLLPFNNEPRGEQAFARCLVLPEFFKQRIPLRRCVANAECFRVLTREAAFFQILYRRIVFLKTATIKLGYLLQEPEEFVQAAVFAPSGFMGDIKSGTRREVFDSLHELQTVVLHQEPDNGPMGATAEAVIELFAGAHGERRRLFVVERATNLVFLAGLLEGNVRADDLDDVGSCNQVVDEMLGDPARHTGFVSVCSVRPGHLRRVAEKTLIS